MPVITEQCLYFHQTIPASMHQFHPTIMLTLRWLGLSFGLCKLISFRLWLSDRAFPLVPMTGMAEHYPDWLHTGLFVLSLFCLLLLIIKPGKRVVIALLISETISCMADWNRLQPWEYFYLFLLLATAWNRISGQIITHWKWIISGLYFYSGLYKIDQGFVYGSFQNLFLIKCMGLSNIPGWLLKLGYVPGILEMLAGLGLIFTRTHKAAACFLITMHLIILLILGPLGLNQNHVVWPWNIFMIYMLWSVINNPTYIYHEPTLHVRDTVIIMAWWIMPIFHMFGYWDAYLSGALYGGRAGQLYVCTEDHSCLPVSAARSAQRVKNLPCMPAVSVYRWAMSEMNIVPYPSDKSYKIMARKLERLCPGRNRYFIVRSGFTYKVEEMKPGP